MATKIKKSQKSSKRAPAKKSFFKNRLAIMFTLLVVLGLGAWGLMRSMAVPSDINLVGTEVSTQKLVTDENGCYLQEVQCVKAPCEPIKVCPTTTTNTGIPKSCVSWFDGCNTCQVTNGVLGACTKKACKLDPNNAPKPYCIAYAYDTGIVPPLTPKPTPIASFSTTPSIPKGCVTWFDGCNKCRVEAGRLTNCTEMACEVHKPAYCMEYLNYVDSTPVATSTALPTPISTTSGIATFYASKPCANDGFLSITYTCKDGRKKEITSYACTNVVTALKTAQSACSLEVSK